MQKDRTKVHIAETLAHLSKTKDLADISVSDICKAAEIDRHTFYYHFKDKYDLIAWSFVRTNRYLEADYSFETLVRTLKKLEFGHVFFKRAFNDTSQNSLREYMIEYYDEFYTGLVKSKMGLDVLDEDTAFSIRMYAYASQGIFCDWINSGTAMPPEILAQRLLDNMPVKLKQYLQVDGPQNLPEV